MAWYRTGTITIASGSPTVTGTGTTFNDTATGPNPGDMLIVGTGTNLRIYEIKTVNSATSLTLATNADVAVTNSAYQIQTSVATSNSGLAKKVSAVMDRMLNSVQNWMTILNGTGNVTITDYNGDTATNRSWPAMNTAIDGKLSKTGGELTGELQLNQSDGTKIFAGNGRLELYASTPFIDFHYDKSAADFSVRIINTEASALEFSAGAGPISFRINGGIRMGGANYAGGFNLYRGNGDANAVWGVNASDGNFTFVRGGSAGQTMVMGDSYLDKVRGILCKRGASGEYGGNKFHYNWTGTQMEVWVDTNCPGAIQLAAVSDRELKKDIEYLADLSEDYKDKALKEVVQWNPATFRYKARGILPESREMLGYIANDLTKVSPECVTGEGLAPGEWDENNPIGAYALDQVAISAKHTLAIQALLQRVKDLETQLAEK